MKFGIMFGAHVDKWELIRYAEELGYDRAWVADSEMIWSDCYATLALAAVKTRKILIGTGIAVPGTRIAPVTAHSIASINQLAPGRVFLGMGTGHTGMRLLGQEPMPVAEFREYLRVVRALLDGGEVDYTYRGRTRQIKFLHRDRYFVNLDQRIPIYVAANGPKALEVAGQMADGWISGTGPDLEAFHRNLQAVRQAAQKTQRTLSDDFLTVCVTSACVLRPGEKLTDERVINETGSMVTCVLHLAYEIWEQLGRRDELVPPFFANVWEDYLKRAQSYSLPRTARFRQIHDGHCTFLQEEERRFVTPEAIRAVCMAGEADEIIADLRALEAAGLQEIVLLPPADFQRKVFRDMAEFVMPTFR